MKIAIVYGHPYDKSFCNAILQDIIKGAKEGKNEVDVMDLNKDQFNPVMSAKDLYGFVKHEMYDEQSINYFERLKTADKLIMIFPIWWESTPAIIKGFIDKVIFPGYSYEYTKSGLGMTSNLTNLKSVRVITTMNTPKILYKFKYGNSIKKSLINGTLKKSGLKNVKWISFSMVKWSKDKKRAMWLKKAFNLGKQK